MEQLKEMDLGTAQNYMLGLNNLYFIIVLLFISTTVFSQKKFSLLDYTNYNTTFHINGNHLGGYAIESEDKNTRGLSLEINSLHGFFFFQYVSISAGLGLDFNINRTYWALPILADLRIYTKSYGEDGALYGIMQFGRNIEIEKVFRKGDIVKLGAGIVIDNNTTSDYIVEIYAKSKNTYFDERTQQYSIGSVGFSIGIKY